MKNLFLTAILLGLSSITALHGLNHASNDPVNTVLRFESLTIEKNTGIHQLFENDSQHRVVFSCEATGIIVINTTNGSQISKSQLEAELTTRISAMGIEDGEVLPNKTYYEVRHECREVMKELLYPEGVE